MKTMTIKVTVTDEEYKFLKWLAKYDNNSDNVRNWTANKEAENLCNLQIRETMEAYSWEMDELEDGEV